MCGEHPSNACQAATNAGSSPRVWGALARVFDFVRKVRLIPTCVGSTLPGEAGIANAPAHPHVCGEHRQRRRVEAMNDGSSPRVWGALLSEMGEVYGVRLIPTCVGSTFTCSGRVIRPSAHPHVCGEHSSPCAWRSLVCGSSPRVWGALKGGVAVDVKVRLIPTCVGSTHTRGRCSRCGAAHPHVCGEHLYEAALQHGVGGSSPRVWGAPLTPARHPTGRRLIPTCVGSTRAQMERFFWGAAHPHVCGEHVLMGRSWCVWLGSSPRVWGALGRA